MISGSDEGDEQWQLIGFVNGTIEKGFVGQLKTLSIRASIEISPNRTKGSDVHPDFRVFSRGPRVRK